MESLGRARQTARHRRGPPRRQERPRVVLTQRAASGRDAQLKPEDAQLRRLQDKLGDLDARLAEARNASHSSQQQGPPRFAGAEVDALQVEASTGTASSGAAMRRSVARTLADIEADMQLTEAHAQQLFRTAAMYERGAQQLVLGLRLRGLVRAAFCFQQGQPAAARLWTADLPPATVAWLEAQQPGGGDGGGGEAARRRPEGGRPPRRLETVGPEGAAPWARPAMPWPGGAGDAAAEAPGAVAGAAAPRSPEAPASSGGGADALDAPPDGGVGGAAAALAAAAAGPASTEAPGDDGGRWGYAHVIAALAASPFASHMSREIARGMGMLASAGSFLGGRRGAPEAGPSAPGTDDAEPAATAARDALPEVLPAHARGVPIASVEEGDAYDGARAVAVDAAFAELAAGMDALSPRRTAGDGEPPGVAGRAAAVAEAVAEAAAPEEAEAVPGVVPTAAASPAVVEEATAEALGQGAPAPAAPEEAAEPVQTTGLLALAVHCPTQMGQNVFIVGGSDAVGGWDVARALPALWTDGHVWRVEVAVQAGVPLEFKPVLVQQGRPVIWQGGDNLRACVSVGARTDVSVTFRT